MGTRQAVQACSAWLRHWAADHEAIVRFRWDKNVTWGASIPFLVLCVTSYLGFIWLLRLLTSRRLKPVPLGPIPALHNLVLLLGSLVMFLGCLIATIVEVRESGCRTGVVRWLLCFPLGTRSGGRVFFWSYVYYLSKLYEFLDTAIVVLRKKPLTFLHIFHHATVVLMCFFWLEYTQSLQIIALLTNTGVHVVMYSYYLLCSLNIRPPWKRLVTNIQILQFLFSFISSLGLLWLHFRHGGCTGMVAWLFNAFFNVSLFFLFLNFHRRQYGQRKQAKKLN